MSPFETYHYAYSIERKDFHHKLTKMLTSCDKTSNSALAAFLRRLKARLGAPKAITATAYKIAQLIYSMLKYGRGYVDVGQDYYDQQYKSRVIENIKKKAKALGFQLLPIGQPVMEVP